MRSVIAAASASTVLLLAGWVVYQALGLQEFDEYDTGKALHDVAEPGDTLVVFGGRSDLQITTGLPSPYEHLWSLPMRTMDPELTDLGALVAGPDAPTWIVEWLPFRHWSEEYGSQLAGLVEERYEPHGLGCGTEPGDPRTVWLLKGTERPVPSPACHAE